MTVMNRQGQDVIIQAHDRFQSNDHSPSVLDDSDSDTRIAALMILAGTGHIAVREPEVSLNNGTMTLSGIVDAFWKKAYLGDFMKDKFPELYVENTLSVIPPH